MSVKSLYVYTAMSAGGTEILETMNFVLNWMIYEIYLQHVILKQYKKTWWNLWNLSGFLFSSCPLDGRWIQHFTGQLGVTHFPYSTNTRIFCAPLVGLLIFCVCADTWAMCGRLWWNIKLANVSEPTLSWWRRRRRDRTGVLGGQWKARPALLLVSPWGCLTQNTIRHKVCFLGLLKSCRHLVLNKGHAIYHSALSF